MTVRLGAMTGFGPVRRSARLVVVVETEVLHAIAQSFLLGESSIALGLDLGLALAIGRLGLLEDVYEMFAL